MTKEQIHKLLSTNGLPGNTGRPELVETHISWVLLGNERVYKIKKPVRYSFLDFSTIEKRKYYCEKEVVLNRRLTDGIYLGIQPVKQKGDRFFIGDDEGTVTDYAVQMKKIDRHRQMDIMLRNNLVTPADISRLAQKIARFHKQTDIITQTDPLAIRDLFNDLQSESSFLESLPGARLLIDRAVNTANIFIEKHTRRLTERLKAGFFRDCHGDLHSRNIFLLPAPQPFDCTEFNDQFRQIDVLNEVAFLCMDLDSFGRQDLSEQFLTDYIGLFPALQTPADRQLFVYYKAYRANIRAKVNSLRAKSASKDADKKQALKETAKYLHLMDAYIKQL